MLIRLGFALYFIMQSNIALASLPYAIGEIESPECTDAMKIATKIFQSQAQRLYAPLTLPEDLQSNLILGSTKYDISEGDAIESTTDFEKSYNDICNIYWTNQKDNKLRIAITETARGWRGDTYRLYLLDFTITKEEFIKNINLPANSTSYQPVIGESWRPPLVFQDDQRKSTWFIDVGQPYEVLSNWRIYSSQKRLPICTIAFIPMGSDPMRALPKPVRRIVQKLDEALGPGKDEGTLQPTARIRLNANHILANAALRPWALHYDDAYNSRIEVDAGLKEWAKLNKSRHHLYNEILKSYPAAERSLVAYYTSVYKLQPKKSEETASWILDLIYRSFFVFSKNDKFSFSEGTINNPWPITQ